MFKCPYDMSKPQVSCCKFEPYTPLDRPPCNVCDVPNPLKAKYFNMPELFDEAAWNRWKKAKKKSISILREEHEGGDEER